MGTNYFAKIYFLGQNGQFGPNLGKNYAILFCNLDLDLRTFLDVLTWSGTIKKIMIKVPILLDMFLNTISCEIILLIYFKI